MKPSRKRGFGSALLVSSLLLAGCLGSVPAGVPHHVPHPIAYLWENPYPDLAVHIGYVPGQEPSSLALDALEEVLRTIPDKRSITILEPMPLPARYSAGGQDRAWSGEELEALSEETSPVGLKMGQQGIGTTAHLHILYLKGHYQQPDGRVSGLHIDGRAFIFRDAMATLNSPKPVPDIYLDHYLERYERKTLIHELGHIFGLVNNGIPMVRPHEEPNNRGHSSNPESVMSHTAEYYDPDRIMQDKVVPYEFDEDDMADLHAFLEKGRSGLHHPANTSAMMGTHPSPASKWQGLAEKPLL